MQFDFEDIIKKSHEALLSAEFNYTNGFYSTCQNRLYYSIFYIVTALAYEENFITSKHSQLMGWFNKEFVYERKIFSDKMFAIYKEAYTARQMSDYDFSYVLNKDEIIKMIEEVKYFVKQIENYIRDSKTTN